MSAEYTRGNPDTGSVATPPAGPLATSSYWRAPVVLGVLVFAAGLLLARPAAAAYYLSVGSQALEGARSSPEPAAQLERAGQALALAWSLNQHSPLIARRLAEVALREGRPDDAVKALEDAYALEPASLLVQQELAQAYAQAGQYRRAGEMWLQQGLSVDVMAQRAHELLRHGHAAEALIWYDRVELLRIGNDPGLQFRHAVASVYAGENVAASRPLVAGRLYQRLQVYEADGSIIPGRAFRWVFVTGLDEAAGTTLRPDQANPGAGIMAWSGDALVFVHVERPGSYRIEVRAQHGQPAPIELSIGINGRILVRPVLTRGDASWENLSVSVELQPGLYGVGVWFQNDGSVAGLDRNALIAWARVVPAAPVALP